MMLCLITVIFVLGSLESFSFLLCFTSISSVSHAQSVVEMFTRNNKPSLKQEHKGLLFCFPVNITVPALLVYCRSSST